MDEKELIRQACACVLIVEDDPAHRELIIEAIKEDALLCNIFCVENGFEALQYLEREGKYDDNEKYPMPDLILLDLKMPGLSGKDLLRKIKTNESMRSIPVIVLTSSIQEEDIEECYRLGANSYVTKPISFGDFFEKVRAIPPYWVSINTLPDGVIP